MAQQSPPPAPNPPADEPAPSRSGAPGSLDTEAVRRSWPEILDKVKEIRRVTWTLVSVNSTVLDYDGRRVLLGLSSEGLASTFNQGVHAEVVRQGLVEAIGLDAKVEGTAAPQATGGAGTVPGSGSDRNAGPGSRGGSGHGSGSVPRAASASAGVPGPGAPPQADPSRDAEAPSAAEQLGVTRGPGGAGSAAPSRPAGAPPAQEWAESAREAPPPWAVESPDPVQKPPAPEQPAQERPAHERPAQERPAQEPPAPERPVQPAPVRQPGGDQPRDDDEDLESSGSVGLPVIESVLGGTVISVDDDPTH